LSSAIAPLLEKAAAGDRLTFDEGMSLYQTNDLNALGKLADTVRRKKHGLTTYYNVNRHFNHTNICVADCKFCGFYKRARQEGAYTHSVQEGIDIARTAVAEGATELHIVGGLNTKLPFSYFTDLLSSLKAKFLADSTVRSADISVDTNNGVVTLSGTAPSPAAHTLAVEMARNTDGVKRVEDQIKVLETSTR